VERIVLPQGQPIELLPRAADVIALQIEVVKRYRLGYEMVGGTLNGRLRILPQPVTAP
jgi:hypothetical protein